MKQTPTSDRIAFALLLSVLVFALLACNFLSPPLPHGNGTVTTSTSSRGNGPAGASTSTPTATADGQPFQDAKYTLEIETYGEVSSNGVTQIDGPFKISIPLEKTSSGWEGHAVGTWKETSSGGCTGERTTQEVLDVTATGKDMLTITITWNATVLSESGICFGVPPSATVTGPSVELPARDGASKRIDFPSSVGNYYEIYTLRIQ